ncbi:MAG: bifunctional UDP-N-acetylglucosamine diphosphorylase/glucosamine-1-phosphate N-acetyltransferase GlmU, partial [Elusimicrobia bacterium]|nr:bifunctional UDP-N-acetylglucosamine diphosphorylase/glucosamine-1-phosphate N-acetyltransferase GlmU [Elusimicrobiota bacterium]
SVIASSRLGKRCRVGPFARISGSRLDDEATAGSFAELENTSLGRGTQAGGHSYLGNCKVGSGVEIGRGFLSTGPADARQTVIEDGAFIGAACHVVAAVTVGRGAFVATGTSITDDAPAGSFVISRGRQVVKTGHARSHAPRRRS